MTAYIVNGDILHGVEGCFSRPIDQVVYLPKQSWNPVENHTMSAIKAALEAEGLN